MNENSPLCIGLNISAKTIHENNKEKGFWNKEQNVGELLMLVTSELGEALEAHRHGTFADESHYQKELDGNEGNPDAFQMAFALHIKDTFEDEIADAVIRLLDLSAGLGIDIEWHINQKVRYNKTRVALHGKLY